MLAPSLSASLPSRRRLGGCRREWEIDTDVGARRDADLLRLRDLLAVLEPLRADRIRVVVALRERGRLEVADGACRRRLRTVEPDLSIRGRLHREVGRHVGWRRGANRRAD